LPPLPSWSRNENTTSRTSRNRIRPTPSSKPRNESSGSREDPVGRDSAHIWRSIREVGHRRTLLRKAIQTPATKRKGEDPGPDEYATQIALWQMVRASPPHKPVRYGPRNAPPQCHEISSSLKILVVTATAGAQHEIHQTGPSAPEARGPGNNTRPAPT